MSKFKLIISFLFFLLPLFGSTQSTTIHQQRLDKDWTFLQGDLGGIWEAIRIPQIGQPTSFPIWEEANLPHCFNATDAVNPDVNYYQGPGWYRYLINLNNPYENGRTVLHFEGAGQKTEVYIGTEKVASHVGGYDEWSVDITDALKEAQLNSYISMNYNGRIPLSIRCDNSRDLEMIPSDLSDFTIYGGLYRHVNLQYFPAQYFSSIKIDTEGLKNGQSGKLIFELIPALPFKTNPEVDIEIVNPQGEIIYTATLKNGEYKIQTEIRKPERWSPQTPALYQLKASISNGDQVQNMEDRFGFRTFEFKNKGPFYLNGERLLLKGTHRHEDFAGVGAALSDQQIRAEMIMIKDMGANFIRLGHYQQSRYVLQLCDSLGILVWEEIPWCRGGLGGKIYQERAIRMLTNMINQHHNHPAVIMWGLGNENDWPGDFETFEKDSIRAFMQHLNNLAHQLDSKRVTSIRRCDFCKDFVDVYSPSIWTGWYRGQYTDYKRVSEFEQNQVDRFFHAEWGGDSHTGRHAEDVDSQWKDIQSGQLADERDGDASLYGGQKRMSKDGDWSESYMVELFDWTLKEQLSMPWLTGSAFWVFKDFATPIRPENPIPYVNQKGVVQRDLTPKETYYVVQSYWADKPMLHIYGHSWPIRWGEMNELKMVKVYSNCSELELFVNGISQGVKARKLGEFPAAGFYWEVKLNEGANHITAKSLDKGIQLQDEVGWNYQVGVWGEIDHFKLSEEMIDDSTSLIKVLAVDANEKVCLDSRLLIEFEAIGEAYLSKDQGTITGSGKIQLANGQAQIKLIKTGKNFQVAAKAPQIGCFFLNH
ncbi:MAG: glycoside hydrolase family 2 TIM barrel-domain containing protein [Prolixibacteraceae bacterium]